VRTDVRQQIKMKTFFLAISLLLVALTGAFLTLRMVALHGADEAMRQIVDCGWHKDTASFFFCYLDDTHLSGPGWYVTYQHNDFSSCFPFNICVSITGKKLRQSPEDLSTIVAAYVKHLNRAEPGDTVPPNPHSPSAQGADGR